MQGKSFMPQQVTSLNTYKCMKTGDKKYREGGSSDSIDNLKSKKRLNVYTKGLKCTYPEDWQERDLDPALMYSSSGGMPNRRFAIGHCAFKKAEIVAAKRSDVKPSNSMSYHGFFKRNQYLEDRHKKHGNYLKVLFANARLDVPKDLEDYLMEDTDNVNVSSQSIENCGTPLTGSCHVQSATPSSDQHNDTHRPPEDSPTID